MNERRDVRQLAAARDAARAKLAGRSPRAVGVEKNQAGLRWVYRWGWSSATIIDAIATPGRRGVAARLLKAGLLEAHPCPGAGGIKGVPLQVLTLTPGGSAYTYNGLRRSAWNYQFLKTESGCWDALSTTAAASQGVLFIPAEAGTYRFTGQGASMQDYIYREVQDETFKTVTLTQNDDYRSDYGGADFTSKEDMGWNCIGLPYLVSAYKPYDTESFTGNARYNMDIPHKLWLYYDGAAAPDGSTVNGDGGYYSVSSWDTTDNWHLPTGSIPSVWVGEGIFTQTAAVSSTEDLTFYRPVYTDPASGAKAAPALTRAYVGTIEQEVATTFTITVRGHIIYVTGLEGDEQITIYDRVGRIYNTAQATSSRYSTAVPTNGVYIVRVNDVSKKVLIK